MLIAVSSDTPKKPLQTLTLRGRFLEYLSMNSLRESSSEAEWEELTDTTLGDLDKMAGLAEGGEGGEGEGGREEGGRRWEGRVEGGKEGGTEGGRGLSHQGPLPRYYQFSTMLSLPQ